MGQTLTDHFTPIQRVFLRHIRSYPDIVKNFYLTGGTALAACYFNHRHSEDIDLFSPQQIDEPFLTRVMREISQKMKGKLSYTRIHDCLRFDMLHGKNQKLKVDFAYYPCRQVEKPNDLAGLSVDSIEDIAVNKLLAISQRTASKDFVDLYFVLKKCTFWDLRIGVEHKFQMDMEPFYIASLLKKVDELDTLPRMKKTLTLDQLKRFFRGEAKRLASTMVKP